MFLYKTQSSAKRQTDDLILLILSGRSFMDIKKRSGTSRQGSGNFDFQIGPAK